MCLDFTWRNLKAIQAYIFVAFDDVRQGLGPFCLFLDLDFFFWLQSMPILPYATKMESKWLVGMWTPVTKCPATNCRPTRQGEEATPPTLLPLVLIELKHSLHNRIPAVDITQMVRLKKAKNWQKRAYRGSEDALNSIGLSKMFKRGAKCLRMRKKFS